MSESQELASCPFCGSPAVIENLSKPEHERHITAGCANEQCFAYLPSVYFAREADAIAAWNRRTPVHPVVDDGMIERAAKAVWNRADDEIGWELSKQDPAMSWPIEWALEDARAALLAALNGDTK